MMFFLKAAIKISAPWEVPSILIPLFGGVDNEASLFLVTMSYQILQASPVSIPKSPSSEKVCKEKEKDKSAPQSAVTYVYQAKVAELCCNVTATWCKNLTSHSLCITVEKPCQQNQCCTCKIDLSSTQFWGKKGLKSFEVDGRRVDVYWDFRQAKFSCTPEPCSNYYVALVSKQEVVVLLGDLMEDAYKRTRSRSSSEEARLMYKKENVCGKGLFCTKAMLEEGRKEHDIVIETLLSGPKDPEMWISVDGTVAIRIMNLNWRFRGNKTVMLNDMPVEIFWDVHDWLFSSLGTSQGFFIFKAGTVDWESSNINYDYGSRNGNCSSCSLQHSPCNSPKGKGSSSNIGGFCHFLYAWKTE